MHDLPTHRKKIVQNLQRTRRCRRTPWLLLENQESNRLIHHGEKIEIRPVHLRHRSEVRSQPNDGQLQDVQRTYRHPANRIKIWKQHQDWMVQPLEIFKTKGNQHRRFHQYYRRSAQKLGDDIR
jgi:hypothetical protein